MAAWLVPQLGLNAALPIASTSGLNPILTPVTATWAMMGNNVA